MKNCLFSPLVAVLAGVLVLVWLANPAPNQLQPIGSPRPVPQRVSDSQRPVERVVVTNAFDWRQVESPDYFEYVRRLRVAQCPERTIREIVFMDLLGSVPSGTSSADGGPESRFDVIVRIMDLIFGSDAGLSVLATLYTADLQAIDSTQSNKQWLAFLELTLRKRLASLTGTTNGEPPPLELVAQSEQIKAEFDRQIQAELGPEAYSDYRYHRSSLPEVIKQETSDMSLAESDIRRLFEIEEAFEREPASGTESDEAANRRASALTEVLGPTRAAEYLRNRSPTFQEAQAYGRSVGLDDVAVRSLADLQQSFETGTAFGSADRTRIRGDVQRLLGALFEHYLANGGYWLAE